MVNHETGEIKTTTSNLNREEADTYELFVEVRSFHCLHALVCKPIQLLVICNNQRCILFYVQASYFKLDGAVDMLNLTPDRLTREKINCLWQNCMQ